MTAKNRRPLMAIFAATLVAAGLMVPHSAMAWWGGPRWGGPRFGIGISVPLVVPAPPPVYYGPPPAYAYYGAPPAYYRPRIWIRPHYNWAGAFIPGHWVYR